MGTSLRKYHLRYRRWYFRYGRCKAIQTGRPSGKVHSAAYLDTLVDYESLAALGSIMGSGSMIVMDESTSMVDVARYFMEFCGESCGRCVPYPRRYRSHFMYNILDKFSHHGDPGMIWSYWKSCDMVQRKPERPGADSA